MKEDTVLTIAKILALLFAVKIVTELLQGLGIFDSKEAKEKRDAEKEFNKGANSQVFSLLFNPQPYWEKLVDEYPDSVSKVNESWKYDETQNFKDSVQDTKGWLNDDEDLLMGLFSQIQDLDELAWLSYYFQYFDKEDVENTGKSLGVFLSEFLNGEDFLRLQYVLQNLEKGTLKPISLEIETV